MRELHFGPKDFKVEWFSGTGKGGQHRNKHQNCCRIIHLETGIRATGTASRERSANQRAAFSVLAGRLLEHYGYNNHRERRTDSEVVRNYHGVRNEVLDKASGVRMTYKEVVVNGNLGRMIAARAEAMRSKE